MDFLRDPIWQFIGAFLGLIAIFITWIIFKLQTQRRLLAYEILTNTLLLGGDVKKELRNKFQISYNGKNIINPRLVEFRVLNSGNSSILSSDFETPIKISFQDSSEIFDVDIVSTKPLNIEPVIIHKKNYLVIKPILLNKGDEIRLKILVNSYSSEISFSGRIAGVKEIKPLGDRSSMFLHIFLLFVIYTFGGVAGVQALILFLFLRGYIEAPSFMPVLNLSLGIASTTFAFIFIFYIFSIIRKSIESR